MISSSLSISMLAIVTGVEIMEERATGKSGINSPSVFNAMTIPSIEHEIISGVPSRLRSATDAPWLNSPSKEIGKPSTYSPP